MAQSDSGASLKKGPHDFLEIHISVVNELWQKGPKTTVIKPPGVCCYANQVNRICYYRSKCIVLNLLACFTVSLCQKTPMRRQ